MNLTRKPKDDLDIDRAVDLFDLGADTAQIAQAIYRPEAWVLSALSRARDERLGKTTISQRKR